MIVCPVAHHSSNAWTCCAIYAVGTLDWRSWFV